MTPPSPEPNAQPISPDHVRRIARLARLALDDSALESHRVALGAVLGYVRRINEIDLSPADAPGPADEGRATESSLRADVPGAPLPTGTALGLAPQTWESYYRVPKVLGDDGGA